jgi:hypothetical protein
MRTIQPEEFLAYFSETYIQEYDEQGEEGIAAILDRGRRWDLSSVLKAGGVLAFPHVHIADCGPYVAAVVQACFESGADRVLALGVMHAFHDSMSEAADRLNRGETKLEEEPLRGFYGHGVERPMALMTWERDHSMYGFRRLFADEARRRGVKAPELIERFPFLTGERPETMPGIEEVEAIARDSVVVSTADHCHHGIGYGHSREEVHYFDEAGMRQIRLIMEEGLAFLDSGDYKAYLDHSRRVAKSDWRDAGVVARHLCGPFKSTILEVVPSDFAKSIYQAPAPTWAAGALVQCVPV